MEITKKQWTMIAIVVGLIAVWYFFLRKKDTKESSFNRKLKERVAPSNAPNCNSGCTLTENKDALGNPADCGNCSSSTDASGNKTYYTCVCPNGSKHAPYRN